MGARSSGCWPLASVVSAGHGGEGRERASPPARPSAACARSVGRSPRCATRPGVRRAARHRRRRPGVRRRRHPARLRRHRPDDSPLSTPAERGDRRRHPPRAPATRPRRPGRPSGTTGDDHGGGRPPRSGHDGQPAPRAEGPRPGRHEEGGDPRATAAAPAVADAGPETYRRRPRRRRSRRRGWRSRRWRQEPGEVAERGTCRPESSPTRRRPLLQRGAGSVTLTIGVDIGGTKVLGGVVDPAGTCWPDAADTPADDAARRST